MVRLLVTRNVGAEPLGAIMHEKIGELPPILRELMRVCPQLEGRINFPNVLIIIKFI